MLEKIQSFFKDKVLHFISQLYVRAGDENKYQPLGTLWPNQQLVFDIIYEGKSVVIVKARQLGISTIIAASLFTKAFLSADPLVIAILSYKQLSSEHILSFMSLMYEKLPATIKAIHPAKITKSEILFLKTGTKIIARSAEEKGGLRSFTCSHLLITEFSIANNPNDLIAAGLAALGKGQLIVEGTADKTGDALQKMFEDATLNRNGYTPVFIPWYSHPLYQLTDDESKDFIPSPHERQLMVKYNLSLNRIAWYSLKCVQFGEQVHTEYPFTYEDAYTQLIGSYIPSALIDYMHRVSTPKDQVYKILSPQPKQTYVIGVDPSGGGGGDYASIHVLNCRTLEVCATFRSNTTSLNSLADIIAKLSIEYNGAYVNSESNNTCGGYLLASLISLKVPIFKMKGVPWVTTSKSRVELYEELRKILSEQKIKTLDQFTYLDLRNVQSGDNGFPDKNSLSDGHFDGGDSLSLAIYATSRVPLITLDPFHQLLFGE